MTIYEPLRGSTTKLLKPTNAIRADDQAENARSFSSSSWHGNKSRLPRLWRAETNLPDSHQFLWRKPVLNEYRLWESLGCVPVRLLATTSKWSPRFQAPWKGQTMWSHENGQILQEGAAANWRHGLEGRWFKTRRLQRFFWCGMTVKIYPSSNDLYAQYPFMWELYRLTVHMKCDMSSINIKSTRASGSLIKDSSHRVSPGTRL